MKDNRRRVILYALVLYFLPLFSFARSAKVNPAIDPFYPDSVAHFHISVPDVNGPDKVDIAISRNVAGISAYIKNEKKTILAINGLISFDVERLDKPVYLSVSFTDSLSGKNKYIIPACLIEPGDSIRMNAKENLFSGRGAAKYTLQSKLLAINDFGQKNDILRSFQKEISPAIFNIIRTDIQGSECLDKVRLLLSEYKRGLITKSMANRILSDCDSMAVTSQVPDMAVKYQAYLFERIYVKQTLAESQDTLYVYNYIQQTYQGALRDKLAFLFIKREIDRLNDSLVVEIASTIQDQVLRETIEEYRNTMRVGVKATDFALPDVNGKLVRLSDYKGKVIFIDFWFTGCKGCLMYYEEILSKAEPFYRANQDVVFISVSIDKSKDKWLNSIFGTDKKSGKYSSPEVVNVYTSGLGTRHPVIDRYQVRGYPRPVLIGRNGRIYAVDSNVLRGRGLESLKAIIARALEERL